MKGRNAVLFRLDADRRTGYGHLFRSLALAQRLETAGLSPVFVAGPDSSGVCANIIANRYAAHHLPDNCTASQELESVKNVIKRAGPVASVVDLIESTRALMELLASTASPVVAIDDIGRNNYKADIIVHPGLLGDEHGYTRGRGCVLAGPRFCLIRPEFAQMGATREMVKQEGSLFVCFGGSDPENLTIRTMDALAHVSSITSAVILVGKGYAGAGVVAGRIEKIGRGAQLHVGSERPWELMAQSSLAVCSVGNTLWELASLRTPAMVITFNDGQYENARKMASLGACVHFAGTARFDPLQLAAAIDDLMNDQRRLAEMGARACDLVDGRGAERVADVLLEKIGS